MTTAIPQGQSGLRPEQALLARAAAALLLLCLALLPGSLVASPAAAATPSIAKVRVAQVTASSFTVTFASLGAGWRYELYASTTKADVYYANLSAAPHRSGASSRPKLTVAGLGYTASPYWYRIQAVKGSHHHTSDIYTLGLQPPVPGSFGAATTDRGAVSLTWSGQASGYTVQQADDVGFTRGVRSYGVRGGGQQLTPYALSAGSRSWFRVRSENGSTASAYTRPVGATGAGSSLPVRAMTYNVLTLDDDGHQAPGGEDVAAWSLRQRAAASYIETESPDVIGVQEGAAWVGAPRGPRQVDSLLAALGGEYALAATETPPDQPHYFRTGNYVLFKVSTVAAVGGGGHWDLGAMPGGGSRWAAYQVLRIRATGTRFLFVSTHLYVIGGATGDETRRDETTSLLQQATSYGRSEGGLPTVYGGDFNSDQRHPLDGPAVVMRAAGVADAQDVAAHRKLQQYNTANQYQRKPPASGLAIDHIYVQAGIGVPAWRQVLKLSAGRFVGVIPSDHNPVVADLLIPR